MMSAPPSPGEPLGYDGLPRPVATTASACKYSVFEIEVDPGQWTSLKARLERLINPEHDSLRYYFLGANWHRRVEHVGAKPAIDLGGPLIV
jgi:CRISPR-associated endonuclease Cas2